MKFGTVTKVSGNGEIRVMLGFWAGTYAYAADKLQLLNRPIRWRIQQTKLRNKCQPEARVAQSDAGAERITVGFAGSVTVSIVEDS